MPVGIYVNPNPAYFESNDAACLNKALSPENKNYYIIPTYENAQVSKGMEKIGKNNLFKFIVEVSNEDEDADAQLDKIQTHTSRSGYCGIMLYQYATNKPWPKQETLKDIEAFIQNNPIKNPEKCP